MLQHIRRFPKQIQSSQNYTIPVQRVRHKFSSASPRFLQPLSRHFKNQIIFTNEIPVSGRQFVIHGTNELFESNPTPAQNSNLKIIRWNILRPVASRSQRLPKICALFLQKREPSFSITSSRKTVIRIHRWLPGKVWAGRIITAQIFSFKRNLFGSIGS